MSMYPTVGAGPKDKTDIAQTLEFVQHRFPQWEASKQQHYAETLVRLELAFEAMGER